MLSNLTSNSINTYDQAIGQLTTMLECASDVEATSIQNAIHSMNEAKLQCIKEKEDMADHLYEAGRMGENEYVHYMNFLATESADIDMELNPHSQEAGLAIAYTLALSESAALKSEKVTDILALETGDELSNEQITFIENRLEKYQMLVESEIFETTFEHDLPVEIMTESMGEFLSCAENDWKEFSAITEASIKEYASDVLEIHGSVDTIMESVDTAIEEGMLSRFAAKHFRNVVNATEMRFNTPNNMAENPMI